MRSLRLATAIAFTALAEPAAAADLHQLWDQRCGGCHGHAGQFARARLVVAEGRLQDRQSGKDVDAFLTTHNGGYTPEDIAAIRDMLAAQVNTPELFRVKCGGCHETAAQLVREQVIRQDEHLVGRYSHRRMADFLPGHAKLSADEQALILETLARVEREVHRP